LEELNTFDEKYKKIVSIAGLTAAFGGRWLRIYPSTKCIAACKGTFSNEYLAELDRLPKKVDLGAKMGLSIRGIFLLYAAFTLCIMEPKGYYNLEV
jgi:hypothetical protein